MVKLYFPTFELLTQGWKHKTWLWVTTSMVELLFFHFLVTKSSLENRKFYFELLTWSWTLHLLNMVSKFPETFYYHEVWNSRVTNLSHDIELRKMTPHIKFITRWLNFYFSTFELLTPSWKIKSFTLHYLLEVEKLKVLLWVSNSKLKNKMFLFVLLTQWVNFYIFTFKLLTQSWKTKSFTLSMEI